MRRAGSIAAALAVGLIVSSESYAADADNALWVTVRINGTEQAVPTLIERDAGGDILAPSVAAETWRLPMLAVPTDALNSNRGMVRLRSRPGFAAQLDEQEARLDLNVAPWLYDAQVIALKERREPLRSAPLALMVDYDVYATSEGDASAAMDTSLAAGRVALSSTWQAGHAAGGGVQRLETALRISVPERMATLTLGDAVGAAMTTTRAVRFTGMQWSSDFTMQPDFLPFALPAAEGVAVVPSTVDLFVNGNYLTSQSVDPGPFAVHDVPVPTGSGDVELRIRDSMGREQRITRRFLATPQLLRPGLVARNFEFGALRRDFGLRDAVYGPAFAAFSIRRGMSGDTTLAVGAEALRRQGTLRAEAVHKLSNTDLISTGVGFSEKQGNTGMAGDISWQHQRSRHEWGSELRVMDSNYVDMASGGAHGKSVSLATQFSVRIAARTGISLIHALRREQGKPATEVLTLSASSGPIAGGSVQAYVTRSTAGGRNTQIGLYYSLAVGRISTGTGMVRDRKHTSASVRMGRSATRETGWGWDASAYTGSDPYRSLRVQSQANLGGGELQIMSRASTTTAAGAWHGGLILQSRSLQLAPELGDSAAVVELPGLANVPVYHDGQLLGRTDTHGRLVAPDLRSYEVNQIRVTGEDIPMAVWLDEETLKLRPYSRNVYRLQFATKARWTEFLLTLPDGAAVPAGAKAEFGDESEVVGDAGLLAAPLASGKTLRVSWSGGKCQALPEAAQLTAAGSGPTRLECR